MTTLANSDAQAAVRTTEVLAFKEMQGKTLFSIILQTLKGNYKEAVPKLFGDYVIT